MSPVAHVVVFSELSPLARAQYTRFLVESNVQFAKRPSDGRYIANVRLQSPSAVHIERSLSVDSPRRTGLAVSPPRRHESDEGQASHFDDEDTDEDREGSDVDSGGDEDIHDGIPVRFRPFAAFIHEVGSRMLSRSSMSTYVTSESKLLRFINDIYDACADDTISSVTMAADGLPPGFFSTFVRVYLKSRFGLQSLVQQQALELLEGLDAHKARLDVEHFTCFLSGHYDSPTLVFFLKGRDVVQEAISTTSALFRPTSAASAKRRRSDMETTSRRQRRVSKSTSALVWLSKSHIEYAAQKAFGSKSDDAYLQFAHQVRSFLATRDAPRPLQQLLELQEFLSLALRTFIELRRSHTAERAGSYVSATSGHQAHDGQDTVDVSPPPSPLPPPPLPRTLGNAVRVASSTPCLSRANTNPPSENHRQSHGGPAPVQPYPALSSGASAGKPPTDSVDDVQTRLSLLMARMEQRRSGDR